MDDDPLDSPLVRFAGFLAIYTFWAILPGLPVYIVGDIIDRIAGSEIQIILTCATLFVTWAIAFVAAIMRAFD